MLDIKFIRENPEVVKKAIKDRGMNLNIDELLELDKKRRNMLVEAEDLKCRRNKGLRSLPKQGWL